MSEDEYWVQNLDPAYGKLSASLDTVISQKKKFSSPIDLVPCSADNNEEDQFVEMGQSLYCLEKITDINLTGAPYASEYRYLSLRVGECRNTSVLGCRPQDEIDRYFNDLRLNVYYQNQMLQFKEFENPIKKFIDDPIQIQLRAGEE